MDKLPQSGFQGAWVRPADPCLTTFSVPESRSGLVFVRPNIEMEAYAV